MVVDMTSTTLYAELKLRDRASGGYIYLTIRHGVVVGAMGCTPKRFVGLTESEARHRARYAQR